jgi:eukaryotic-like serine/threonine-protein kinase
LSISSELIERQKMPRFERWLDVKRIFEEALEVEPAERAAFLDRACKDDPELRREVEALIDAPAVPTSHLADLLGREEEPDFAEGDRIDHFTIVRRVGLGGMGAVYEARDTKNNDRRVAIKVLFSRTAAISQDKRLALMSHPAIVTFHDSGETAEGLPYFVFEFIEGEPITAYCDRHKLGLPDRLRLFQSVSEAVGYAHQRGLIHCDLKPENILVTAGGKPKLLDFGIARAVGEPGRDPQEPSPITLPFASPEQVAHEETTTLSDVYSLGVVLAVLLTGRLPYTGARTLAEIRDAILQGEIGRLSDLALLGDENGAPPPFSLPATAKNAAALAKQLRGDLDAIAARAMHQEPAGRYQSAPDLATDIERHLTDHPVAARGDSRIYRTGKFLKRNRGTTAVAAVFVLVVLASVAFWFRQFRETVRQRDQARQSALQAKESKSMLLKALAFYDPEIKISDLTIGEFLDRTAREIPVTMQRQPGAQVELLTTLAQVYIDRDMHSRAEQVLQTALSLCRKGLAPAYPSEADTLTWLGDLRREEGKLKGAEDFLRQSIKIRQTHAPVDDPDLLFTLLDLGQVEEAQFRRKEAEELYRRVLALRLRAPRPDRVAIAQSLNALGALLSSEHRDAEAENLLRRSLAIREAAFGHDHPLVANTMENLGEVLGFEKKTNEAETLYRSALLIYKKLFGPRNHRTITATTNLGSFLVVAGRPAEGVGYLREAATYAKEVHHPLVIELEVLLARALALTAQFDEADKALDDAYAAVSHTAGTPLMLRATVIRTQGQVALKRGDFATAEMKLKTAAAMFLESGNKATDHVVVATRSELGEALTKRGRFAEAEPLLLAFLDVASPIEMAKALGRVIELYHAWGRTEKEATYRSRLDEMGKRSTSSPSLR